MFKAITFDCFGTLIDWRLGQRRVLEQFPSLRAHGKAIDTIIEARGPIEIALESQEWMPYEQILETSITKAVAEVTTEVLTPTEARAFAASQLGWPVFADTLEGLRQLSEIAPLGLLSNCDTQTLALCVHKHFPGIEIPIQISSESLRSYKPKHAHWGALLSQLECDPHEILHVSFTEEYDLQPASDLGFSIGFVDREKTGPPADITLHFLATDLKDLAQQLN